MLLINNVGKQTKKKRATPGEGWLVEIFHPQSPAPETHCFLTEREALHMLNNWLARQSIHLKPTGQSQEQDVQFGPNQCRVRVRPVDSVSV